MPVGSVVAIRYHNVMCALKLGKPTIVDRLRRETQCADGGHGNVRLLPDRSRSLDVDRLIEQFTEMESRSVQLRRTMAEHNAANARLLDDQFAELSALLFPAAESPHPVVAYESAREGIH